LFLRQQRSLSDQTPVSRDKKAVLLLEKWESSFTQRIILGKGYHDSDDIEFQYFSMLHPTALDESTPLTSGADPPRECGLKKGMFDADDMVAKVVKEKQKIFIRTLVPQLLCTAIVLL
jgi:hypothetical protein